MFLGLIIHDLLPLSVSLSLSPDLSLTPPPCPVPSCPGAVQFDGADWERSAAQTERARPPRTNPLAGGGVKFRRASDSHGVLGERVDPALPLEKQVYVPRAGLARSR